MTYEERVRSIAEEMAIDTYEKNYNEMTKGLPFQQEMKFDINSPVVKSAIRQLTESFIPAARIAVKHMAEMYQTGFIRFLENSEHTAACERICSREMQELGLVPDKEDGNND